MTHEQGIVDEATEGGVGESRTAVRTKAARLRELFNGSDLTQVVGVNDGLSGKLAEKHGFDALWASGFAISTAHGVPDASILTMTEYLTAANTVTSVTSLPVIADCDTGFGGLEIVTRMVREYERTGIAAVCIEDKLFPKRNSFTDDNALLPAEEFSAKLRVAKQAQTDPNFMVIARIESLIAGLPLGDALERAECYQAADADAILIHSKSSSAEEVIAFAREWCGREDALPLIAVPTTYYSVTKEELEAEGFSMVIYANHAMRATWAAIDRTFECIRADNCTAGIEEVLTPVADVLRFSGIHELRELSEPLAAYRQPVS
jgi:phosphoenolpyruvate phosphomutase